MKRNSLILPVLAVLALLISLLWWFWGRTAWRPPPALKPDLPPALALAPPPPASTVQARERPLMWSSRRPAEAKTEEEPADKPSETVNELSTSRLMAVLESGVHNVALLQKPDGSVLKISSRDPDGGAWKLDSFDGVTAQFIASNGERVERTLEKQAGAASAARATGARAFPQQTPAAGRLTPAVPSRPAPASMLAPATPAVPVTAPPPSVSADSTRAPSASRPTETTSEAAPETTPASEAPAAVKPMD